MPIHLAATFHPQHDLTHELWYPQSSVVVIETKTVRSKTTCVKDRSGHEQSGVYEPSETSLTRKLSPLDVI